MFHNLSILLKLIRELELSILLQSKPFTKQELESIKLEIDKINQQLGKKPSKQFNNINLTKNVNSNFKKNLSTTDFSTNLYINSKVNMKHKTNFCNKNNLNHKHFFTNLENIVSKHIQDLLGVPLYYSLKNTELDIQEIEQINHEMIAIYLESFTTSIAKLEIKLDNDLLNLKTLLINSKILIVRPELSLCINKILDYLKDQGTKVAKIENTKLDSKSLLNIADYKVSQNQALLEYLPTIMLNMNLLPTTLIYLYSPLNKNQKEFIQNQILQTEYLFMAKQYGPRISTILDPFKYVQHAYLGLIANKFNFINKNFISNLSGLLNFV